MVADFGGGTTDFTARLIAERLASPLTDPGAINELLEGNAGSALLGGALLIVIFEGEGDAPELDLWRRLAAYGELRSRRIAELPPQKTALAKLAFVGLVAPHLVRTALRPTHRVLLPLAALAGGVLLLAADVLGRWLLAPQELPVGAVTAVLGGGYLLWLMHRRPL